MTMKRFKDYRMFWVILVLFGFFIGTGTYSLLIGNKLPAIGCFLLATIAFFMTIVRYKNILMDDTMMIYEWKIMAMLPTMIEYKDIQSVEKIGKHRLVVKHKKESYVYVFDSDAFIDTYQQLRQEFDKTYSLKK